MVVVALPPVSGPIYTLSAHKLTLVEQVDEWTEPDAT